MSRRNTARQAMQRLALVFAALALAACRAAPAAPATAAPAAVAPNRDPHGTKDVAKYIENLEAPTRVEEMRPDFVVAQLQLASDDVIADLGCGPGVFTLRFAQAAASGVVYAVDIEPRQLDRLREHLLATGIENVVPVLCSPTSPHLPPGSCDVIFIGDTYHHLRERVAYMRQLKRALAANGRLVVFEYKPGQLPVGPPPAHKLQEGELARELTEAGYELVTDFASHAYHDFQVWRVNTGGA